MNWFLEQAKKLLSLASCPDECSIHEQDTEETIVEEMPDLAKIRVPELRSLAAERGVGDGRYRGLRKAELIELITQSYQK